MADMDNSKACRVVRKWTTEEDALMMELDAACCVLLSWLLCTAHREPRTDLVLLVNDPLAHFRNTRGRRREHKSLRQRAPLVHIFLVCITVVPSSVEVSNSSNSKAGISEHSGIVVGECCVFTEGKSSTLLYLMP